MIQIDLLDQPSEYASATFPPPRDFQQLAHGRLRDGRRDGHKNQILMAPTGAGKTYLGLNAIQQALMKGRRALFVCDRTTLIEQTSASADRYGLGAHGIIQADHWRTNASFPFQIASAQTLDSRGWPEADLIVIDECFPPDVEVLTERGFIRFDQLPRGVRCAQYEDGAISFVNPTDYIDKPYEGDLIRVHNVSGCDVTMTPGHQLYTKRGDRVLKVAAEDVKFGAAVKMIGAGESSAESDPVLTPWERLMIAHQADGSIHHEWTTKEAFSLSFSFTKQRKLERFEWILRDGGWDAARSGRSGKTRLILSGLSSGSKLLSDHFDLGAISVSKARAIIAEMVEWDGSKVTPTLWYYSSIVKANADFYQAVATLAGYRSRLTIQIDERSESFSDVHRLFIRLGSPDIDTQRMSKETVKHSGRVYCIRVPSGNIIVRGGGKPLVVGNCHTQHRTWVAKIMHTHASVIGLSATPFSKGLGKLFTNLINAATMAQLVDAGVLVPMRVLRGTPADMTGAATSGGEWTDAAAAERGMQIVGDVVAEWVRYGEGRKTICFGSTVAHCEEICAQFVKAGIMAALYVGTTSAIERKSLLEEYTKDDTPLKVLISVEALAKGFDVPAVSCVIDCRPMRKSLSTVIQMWGRGLRSCPGKTECVLLDHSGNSLRFHESFEEIYFNGLDTLDAGEKMDSEIRKEPGDDKPPKGCPKCGFTPFFRRCMRCGHEHEVTPTQEHVPGTMEEVQLGKGRTIDRAQLYHECVAYARFHSAPEKQKGRAAHLFREMTGAWPPWEWAPSNVPADTQISKAVYNKIVYSNIKSSKSKGLQAS